MTINKFSVIALVLLTCFSLNAFSPRADSLLNKMQNTAGEELIDIMNELVPVLIYSSIIKSDSLAQEAIKLSQSSNYLKGNAKALYNAGKIQNYKKDFISGLDYLRQAESIASKLNDNILIYNIKHDIAMIYYSQGNYQEASEMLNKIIPDLMNSDYLEIQAKYHNSLGLCFWRMGNFETALDHYNESLKINPEKNHNTLNNISIIYGMSGNLEQSLKFQMEALAIRLETDNKEGILDSYNNLGLIYRNMNKPYKALEFLKKSVNVSEALDRPAAANKALNNIGSIYDSALNMPDSALFYYNRSIQISAASNEQYEFLNTKLNIGYMHAKMGDFSKGRSVINEVLENAKQIKALEIVKHCYVALSGLEEKNENFKDALQYYKKYTAVNDSLFTASTQDRIAEMQVKYETEKNILENEKFKLQIADNEKKHQLLLIGYGSFFLIIILIYIMYRQQKRHNNSLAKEIQIRTEFEEQLENIVKDRTQQLLLTNQELKEEIQNHKIAKEKLKEAQTLLEHKVMLRTKELESANESLNRKNHQLAQFNEELSNLNKQFVGREFRIKELKDQIKDLNEKLGL